MKKRLAVVLALLLFTLGAGWITPSRAATPNISTTVVINEVYAPNLTYSNQYFELYNKSAAAIDLSSYYIYNSGGFDQLNTIPPSPIINPGQHLAIGATVFTSGTIGSGLNPTADFLALVQRNGTQDTVIDVVNWGTVNPNWTNYPRFQQYFWVNNAPTMPTSTNLSLQRWADGYDTDQPSDWAALPATAGQPPPATPTPTVTPTITATPTSTAVGASVTATPTYFCNDVYEPDNNPSQAVPLQLGTEQQHTICNTANPGFRDEDWFTINVVANKVYKLYTSNLGGGLDTIMAVYTYPYDGTKLFENDDAPGCLCSEIDASFPANGIYLVRVRDNRQLGGLGWTYTVGFTANPGPAPSSTPTFTVTPNPNAPTATSTPGNCLDAYEPDGTPNSATLFLIGEIQRAHTFCPNGDADWYRLFGGRGKAYTISTSNLGIGVDTYMYLFDSDGHTVLAENDDIPGQPPSGGPNDAVSSSIQFFPVRDDFYYIMVKNKGDLGAPYMTYDISMVVQANVPPPAGTPTPIIAPIVTVTVPPLPTVAPPTDTPLPTPVLPTAPPTASAADATATAIAAVAAETAAAETAVPSQPTDTPVPAETAPPADTATPVSGGQPTELPTVAPIGLPVTGHAPDPATLLTVPLRVYLDRNGNRQFTLGEGIRNLRLVFLDEDGTAFASAVTDASGNAQILLPRNSQAAVSIPYLRWTGKIDAGPAGLTVRLPQVTLPTHIP